MDIKKKTIASSNWWLELMAESIIHWDYWRGNYYMYCIICSAARWELIQLRAVADTAFQADIMDKVVIQDLHHFMERIEKYPHLHGWDTYICFLCWMIVFAISHNCRVSMEISFWNWNRKWIYLFGFLWFVLLACSKWY